VTGRPPLHTLSVGSAGPRVAFLHGLFGQGRNWQQVAKALAGPDGTAARCSLVDLPDHSRSPWSREFSFEGYAASVAETLRAVDPDARWVLVGHSLGGKTAMLVALQHPELVERLAWWGNAAGLFGSAHDAWQTLRGLRTLPLRIDRQEASARRIAA